jgi:hypothetical protein
VTPVIGAHRCHALEAAQREPKILIQSRHIRARRDDVTKLATDAIRARDDDVTKLAATGQSAPARGGWLA